MPGTAGAQGAPGPQGSKGMQGSRGYRGSHGQFGNDVSNNALVSYIKGPKLDK